ncbi:MAG: TetR/AcrR family transcriptional regulator [Pseudomonadota bacterium]
MSIRTKIAGDLDRQFSALGFAEQGVQSLRAGADVSLRTLYKYFPSREAMILGALEHRDKAYFEWLTGGPIDGVEHVLHPIVKLGEWLENVANTGCLFMTALADHPNNDAIAEAVRAHKARLADEFRRRLRTIAPDRRTDHLAETLFLLHEGMTQTARLHGHAKATEAALDAARAALAGHGIT